MDVKWIRSCGMLAGVLVLALMVVIAQGQPREPRWDNARGWPRGEIQVTNDWQEDVKVSMWSSRGERIGEWIITRGANTMLEADGVQIKVRPSYKIKVGWCSNLVGRHHESIGIQ
jgi:hypothetical protein